MRKYALILLVAGCANAQPRDPLHFERHFLVLQIDAILDSTGFRPQVFLAVEMYPFTGLPITGDTLRIAIQHFHSYPKTEILHQSNAADLLIACYPERMTIVDRKNHVFHDAKGLIGVTEFGLQWRGSSLHMLAVFALEERVPMWVATLIKNNRLKVVQP